MHGLFTTASRRTSKIFAIAVIHAITKALEQRYEFLKYVKFNIKGETDELVKISPDLNTVDTIRMGRAVEAIVKIIYMDFKDRAGFNFINEFKKNTGEKTISDLLEMGVDFELLHIQQQYIYRQDEKYKSKSRVTPIKDFAPTKEKSLLDYSLENISNWDYDDNNRICIIYDKDGNVLDQLDLDEIVRKYIGYLTKANTIG